MVMQAASSLLTYASLGWAAHSPLFAAALSLGEAVVHVGACAYGHIVGPPLDGVVKFFSDWLIRRNEYEADAYVARMSDKYGAALQTALAKLSVNSNQDPDMPVWYEALHADHPTTANRWANIEAVRRERDGEAGRHRATLLRQVEAETRLAEAQSRVLALENRIRENATGGGP
jgi:Zn-dependent protease with chaperone function